MLTTSVLHILDRSTADVKAPENGSPEEFRSWLDAASVEKSQPEKPEERQNETAGPAQAPLPDEVPAPMLNGQRGMGELMRALEEVKKEERPPLLDVFE